MATTLWLALAIFAATFAFALLLAAIAPLVLAAEGADKDENGWKIGLLQLDKLVLMLGCIPVFWFVLLMANAPEEYAAVRRCWSEQCSIRVMFWVACILAGLSVTAFQLAMR